MNDHISNYATLKTIEIIVSQQGESRVETHGFTGSECQKASQFLEMALGKQTTTSLKPEFYAQTHTERAIENKF
jgi:hypothetical protein